MNKEPLPNTSSNEEPAEEKKTIEQIAKETAQLFHRIRKKIEKPTEKTSLSTDKSQKIQTKQ